MSIDGLCRSCGSGSLTSILDLGLQPFAGDYPDPADPAPEARWPLRTAVCSSCRLLQLVGDVPMEPQEPGTAPAAQSSTMRDHARRFAAEVAGLPKAGAEPIVEVASHGGYLHEYLAELGVDSVVAERSPSLIADLRRRGVPVRDTGLGHETAGRMPDGREGSPVVVDNYLLAHVPDPNDLVAGMREALAPGGHLVLEFDHALTIVADGQFDAFRHGHFTYWSLYALDRLLQRHGLIAVDVTEQPVYGGALRVIARRTEDALSQGPAISRVLDAERLAGLDRPETYTSFAGRVTEELARLRRFLADERAAGRLVVGYGAPTRGATLLNAAGVTSDLLPYTVDRASWKQGRLMPGSRILIDSPERLRVDPVDVVLILTWDISAEVIAQLSDLRERGVRFAIPIPSLAVTA